MHEDELLWREMKAGNMNQLLTLYKKYYHTLLFIGMKEVKDAQLVKDAGQQQFMYLWEKNLTLSYLSSGAACLTARDD